MYRTRWNPCKLRVPTSSLAASLMPVESRSHYQQTGSRFFISRTYIQYYFLTSLFNWMLNYYRFYSYRRKKFFKNGFYFLGIGSRKMRLYYTKSLVQHFKPISQNCDYISHDEPVSGIYMQINIQYRYSIYIKHTLYDIVL